MRDRIIVKTLQQMNSHGVRFTTADLARELGVSKRLLYEYFSSKEEMIGAVFDRLFFDLQQQTSAIVDDPELDIIEKLRSLMVAYPKVLGPINERVIDDVRRYLPNEWTKFEAYHQEKWRKIEEIINQGVNSGVLRPFNLAILRKIFLGAINELMDYQFWMQNDITLTNAMNAAAEVLIFGLIDPELHSKYSVK